MLEEFKSQLESLAQEVALLKEQQALQTGECGGGLSGQRWAREKGSGRQPAPRWLRWASLIGRAPLVCGNGMSRRTKALP